MMWKRVLLMNIPCNINRRDLHRSTTTPQSNAKRGGNRGYLRCFPC
jgi:hypothetical protein